MAFPASSELTTEALESALISWEWGNELPGELWRSFCGRVREFYPAGSGAGLLKAGIPSCMEFPVTALQRQAGSRGRTQGWDWF